MLTSIRVHTCWFHIEKIINERSKTSMLDWLIFINKAHFDLVSLVFNSKI